MKLWSDRDSNPGLADASQMCSQLRQLPISFCMYVDATLTEYFWGGEAKYGHFVVSDVTEPVVLRNRESQAPLPVQTK